MQLDRLWLSDFRSYQQLDLTFAPGLTAIVGANGQGKTNLLEAISYLATLSSFRGAPGEALVRNGAEQAIVRAEGSREDRALLIEAEINRAGRNRIQVNRQRLARSRDLLGALRVTVFSPDDLILIKGGPSERRGYLDDVAVAEHPRRDAIRTDLDKIVRQRNALLKQARGRLTSDIETTLDVWDAKFVETGEQLVHERLVVLDRLRPAIALAYAGVAHGAADVSVTYVSSWWVDGLGGGLADALRESRGDDVRRGVSTVGPHRDDLELRIDGLPSRTHASQGEQRSLALALRLSAHAVVTEATGTPPILILDDVFSELDPERSDALLSHLPAGQTLLSTTGGLPPGAAPELVVTVESGRALAAAPRK